VFAVTTGMAAGFVLLPQLVSSPHSVSTQSSATVWRQIVRVDNSVGSMG
jgi:hypothetical protein